MPVHARTGFVAAGSARLQSREIGEGPSVVVLHGGPDFDYDYLLPELDRLAEHARLIYYDQRGRGRSAGGVQPGDVTVDSELADLDLVRRHFGLKSMAVLGTAGAGCWRWSTPPLPRCGHFVYLEAPDAVVQHVRDLFGAGSTAGRP